MPRRASKPDPIDIIVDVNRGRDPHLMRRKFDAMAADAFVFLRATAALGHRAFDLDALPPSPLGWVCGDLHLQNFGCFRGANRLVYFDLNDFDEAARLPVAVDLMRFLTSIFTAAPGIGLERAVAHEAAQHALDCYAMALSRGKPFWLERETARGAVRRLLMQVSMRRRRTLLSQRTRLEGRRRRVAIDGRRYLALAPDPVLHEALEGGLAALAERFGDARFFRPRDFAFRVAGMGSLGVARYVALVRGNGDPDRNALIDFKYAARSSAADAFPSIAQPHWPSEAARVVIAQDLCQAASPAFLTALPMAGASFVVRELQPVEDKMALPHLARRSRRLDDALGEMARLAAYAQLRSAGRMGATGADALVEFGDELRARPRPWLDTARAVDAANRAAFSTFRTAWRKRDPRLTALCEPAEAPAAKSSARRRARTASRKASP
jgi:uncharacterized protein (DUF2252 family)